MRLILISQARLNLIPASATNRGQMYVISGPAGVEDYVVQSEKSASGTYSWVTVSQGGP